MNRELRRPAPQAGISIRIAACMALLCLSLPAACVSAQQLTITNPLSSARMAEVVDLPLSEVLDHTHFPSSDHLSAFDEHTYSRLPSQLYKSSPDLSVPDRFLILVELPAHGHLRLGFRQASNDDANHTPPAPLVYGREAPERKDDFAWENQLVAYRVYGPALQATGEIASGIDVWSKRVPNFVIDSFYRRDAEGARTHDSALSYHKDNGQGLDSYEVGPSRGCGGTAVFADGKLYPSKNYTGLKVLSTGPIRFSFELTYAPWSANGIEVNETKRITLDAGSRLNRIAATFEFAGTATIDIAAGLAVHKGADASQPAAIGATSATGSILSVWDTPQDPSAGRIATGMVSIDPHRSVITAGHALMLFAARSGQTIHYSAGSGWSKADMPTSEAWNAYLQRYLLQEQHPLQVHWDH